MEIPTAKTQVKLRQLIHQDMCADSTCTDLTDEDSLCYRRANRLAVRYLGLLMPVIATEMFPAVRADERDKVAYHITAELVCCDIHERLGAEAAKGRWDERDHEYKMPESWWKLKKSHDYHAICHYGAWAASLAKEGPELDKRYEGWAQGEEGT